MNEDGTMARVPDLIEFCALHGLKMVTVADLIRYRLQHERYIHRVAEATLPTEFGEFRMIAYENEGDNGESHVALVMGDVTCEEAVPVRVHTHSLAEDVFGLSAGPNSPTGRDLIDGALRVISEAGCGALLYLHSGTRGFGIDRTVTPHRIVFQHGQRLRERGGAIADDHATRILRQVGIGIQILSDLGIRKIRLLTNTPTHVPALQGFGIEIIEQLPIPTTKSMHY
jgi:3,4-dihydroxy 2-butanone 4-phosphate synthase/GTP cyclohydrolase II